MKWESPLPNNVTFNRTLFKYRGLRLPDGNVNTNTKSIFTQRALWFDNPASFNDPFDCNLRLRSSTVPEHIVQKARREAEANWPDIPKEVVESAVQAVINKPGIGDASFEQCRKRIYEQNSVFCWADNGNNVAMYAYYADNHKGICLQFEIEHRHILGQVMTVNYMEEFPNLDYSNLTGTSTLAESLLLTKALCWQHEKELRVIRHDEPPGLVAFPPEFLSRVIFGCRSTEEDIEIVKTWLAGWPAEVQLARAVPDDKSFSMKIEDFEAILPADKDGDSSAL